ncbi:hypothetical protein [Corallococcus sp. AB045]|uniref:hypothetical protein n=1 Tax=Corallococcus sp. AB045 TaxID=2316719 RepID=UPI0018F7B0BB|nr:hypothetical protein [Corallococcus sp. AB045]
MGEGLSFNPSTSRKQYLKAITLRAKRERIVQIDGELSVEAVTDACLKEVRRLFARKR